MVWSRHIATRWGCWGMNHWWMCAQFPSIYSGTWIEMTNESDFATFLLTELYFNTGKSIIAVEWHRLSIIGAWRYHDNCGEYPNTTSLSFLIVQNKSIILCIKCHLNSNQKWLGDKFTWGRGVDILLNRTLYWLNPYVTLMLLIYDVINNKSNTG